MSRLRANQITNENANGAPNFPHGLTVTGIVTATTSATTMSQIVVGSAVTANSGGVDVTGIVTARDGVRVTSTTGGIAVGTNAMVSGRADNVLHLHKASDGTADGPTIYFTNQQTGVTGSDGLTIGLNDSQSPYIWNRENTATRFGTNNAERLRIGPAGQIGVGGANYGTSGQFLQSQGSGSAVQWATVSAVIKKIHSFELATRTAGSSNNNNNQFTWTSSFTPLDPVNNSFWIDGSVPIHAANQDWVGIGLRFERSGGNTTDFNGYGIEYADVSQGHMSLMGYNFTYSGNFDGAGTYSIYHRTFSSSSHADYYAPNSSDDSRLSAQTRGFLQIVEYKNA